MKKIFYIVLFLTLFIFYFLPFVEGRWGCLFSQPVTQEWVRRYDSPPYNQYDLLSDMTIDTLGNVYETGNTIDPGQGNNYATIKYNTSGDLQWAEFYNGPGTNSTDAAEAITVDRFGNVYVTGESEEYGLWTDAYCTVKYNSNGAQQWVRRYQFIPGGPDDATAIAVDDSGNVYVTGFSWGGSSNNYDFATIKYNINGDTMWVKRYNGPGSGDDRAYSIAVDKFHNVYVTGFSFTDYFTSTDFCTIKYNITGEQQWVSRTSESGTASATKIKIDNFGNEIVTGSRQTISQYSNYVTIKYDSNGTQLWRAEYKPNETSSNAAFDIILDKIGNSFVTGSSYISGSGTNEDFATIKYDINGDSVWVRRYSGPGSSYDIANSIEIDSSNFVYVTGRSDTGSITIKYNNFGIQQYIIPHPHGIGKIKVDKLYNIYVAGTNNQDFITIKYSQPNGIISKQVNEPQDFYLSQNYPNPFNSQTRIEFAIPQYTSNARVYNVKLKIYNILGMEVETVIDGNLQPGIYQISLDGTNYSSGAYFYKIEAGSFVNTKKMVLVK